MTAYRQRLDDGHYAQGVQEAPPAKRRPGRPRADDTTAPSYRAPDAELTPEVDPPAETGDDA